MTIKIRIVFQDITDEAKVAGYDHHAPLLAFVEVNDYDTGKSIKIGEWVADGEYQALDIELEEIAPEPDEIDDGRDFTPPYEP
jgi:hypothetical protein